jgi:hypothetical protein
MKRCGWFGAMGAALFAIAVSGCASDDVKAPEAELETPGAFVAIDGYDADNEITLVRMIDRLDFQVETLLFFSVYDVKPANWDEAREVAKGPEPPLRIEIDAQPRPAITERPWRVVWFRTLTAAERGRVK